MELNYLLQAAQQLDAEDRLAAFRQQFIIPTHNNKEHVYFLGNSLGLQPKQTKIYIEKILQQWADLGVESFFKGDNQWLAYHDSLTATMAEITGCLPHEITVMNQLTVNLHLMLVSFYKPQGKRNKILCEAKAFPSDQYMLETHVRHYGLNPEEVIIEVQPQPGTAYIQHTDILSAIDKYKEELALVLFGGVNYYSGQAFNIAGITHAAQKAGAMAGFDLAHAAGNIELQLHNWNVDFACWCNYKYLNAGPGAIGAAYIHERYHRNDKLHRFAGWWGYDTDTRFEMKPGFVAQPNAEGWQLSTPSILLYACLKSSLDIVKNVGWQNVLNKNRQLNKYTWFLLSSINSEAIKIFTPADEYERGCQVSLLMLKNGKQIFNKLSEKGFMTDWREPDVIRFAPVALYNSYYEVWRFVMALKELVNINSTGVYNG